MKYLVEREKRNMKNEEKGYKSITLMLLIVGASVILLKAVSNFGSMLSDYMKIVS